VPKKLPHFFSLRLFLVVFFAVALAIFLYFVFPTLVATTYERGVSLEGNASSLTEIFPVPWKATHLPNPAPTKALYMTSYVAGNKEIRAKLVELADTTEINTLVIDIKDYSGYVSFKVEDPTLIKIGSSKWRIPDVKEFIQELHGKNIYVIGRVAVFQDPLMVTKRPDLAVKRASDQTLVWEDYKGISWIDPGSVEYWDYMVSLGKEAYRVGFDELNFDYIRFPSDGNMTDIFYPSSDGRVKREVLADFFAYLHDHLKPTGVALSADLFGMTTTNTDDLNIGQVLEDALPYFDFIDPMVYPSHYPPTFMGFANPAVKPYEVVKYSMEQAVSRASTTPFKLRPWLQDFDLGADYTPEMVRAQIQATYDVGLTSWMLWNARNVYTGEALDK